MSRQYKFRPWLRALESREVPATFTVQNLMNSGTDSLRNCIIQANGSPGADTIDFAAGLNGIISLTGGDIGVTESVTIQGPGAKLLSISGAGAGRIFTTKNTVAFTELAVIGVTLTGGNDAGGGAVLGDDERLIFQDCQITGNVSTGGGGAIYLTGNGTVQMFGTTVSGNQATLDGGGVCINGTKAEMYIYNSTLSGNSAGGDGGGVYIKVAANNALFIWNTTIASNSANRGGGIALDPASTATCSVDSCIVSNNSAPTGPDCFAPALVFYYTALSNKSGLTVFSGDATTNTLLGQDFKLGVLVNNGGNVTTHKPALDSPVRDKAQNISGVDFDNRGVGFPREINALVDCGAVECDPLFVVKNDKDSGPDSLRQQIDDANALAGANTITFDAVAFASTDDTITLTTGEIDVYGPLTIVGPGARAATISGNNATRIFDMSLAPTSTLFVMSGLTIAQGSASTGPAMQAGHLSTVSIVECTIRDNSSTGEGGAIRFPNGGSLLVSGSTISGNTAGGRGGAIAFFPNGGSFSLENTTFTKNTTTATGSAISLDGTSLGSTIRNCTIVGNSSTGGGSAAAAISYSTASSVSLQIDSSVIANNVNGSNVAADLSTTAKLNVIANASALGSSTGITTYTPDAATTALLGQDFQLGVLANNGGPTDTILPTTALSPLINAGTNPMTLLNDQRGVGYGRSRSGTPDIGAVEFPTNFVVSNTLSNGAGSLRNAVSEADAYTGFDVITFEPAMFSSPATITLGSAIAIDDAVEIQGRGANLTTINAAKNGRVFNTSAIPTGGKVVISGLRMINGVVADDGGALKIGDENVFVVACEFSGHSAVTAGGAIVVNGGSLTIVDSTLAGNSVSAGNGGGINFSGAGTLNVRNCTFSANTASTSNGGGVSLDNHTGSSSFMNCTFTLNSSFTGGGIGRFAGSSTINIESCIVSGNSAASGPDIATSGTLDAKTSLLGTVAATTFTKDAVTTNLLGKSAGLGTLANNGGPTRTHRPASTSPAVNQGSNPFNLAYDQRGTGFARSAQGGIEVGAVEANMPARFTGMVFGDGTAQRSMVTQIKVSFDSVISLIMPDQAFAIVRSTPLPVTPANYAISIDNSTGVSIATLTFTGGSVDGPSLADGRYNLNILASQFAGAGFDANGDGMAGDNFSLIGTPANGMFRLFGDADGNGTVTAADFNAFRLDYGTTGPSYFDFDNSGSVTASDFNAFRTRYGVTI